LSKVLFCASTLSHIKNFHIPYLRGLGTQGHEIWVVSNESGYVPYADHVISFPLKKQLWSLRNLRTIFAVRKLIKSQQFDLVSTHTTLASVIIRMAVLFTRKRPKVINTCHGYLFNEKDRFKKWVFILPELICASVTDVLMVMNHEDYRISSKYKLYSRNLEYINGMGIDLEKFRPKSHSECMQIRLKYGLTEADFVFIYAAEFSKRKNHKYLIRSFAASVGQMPTAKLFLAGSGKLFDECVTFARKMGVQERVLFSGHVEDMQDVYAMSDVSVSTSRYEGLPFNIMESMASGLPVIASNIKGHQELIDNGFTGFLCETEREFSNKFILLYREREQLHQFGTAGLLKIQEFGLGQVYDNIMSHYRLESN
jgi:glycosyltransferase EpsD